MSIRDYLETKNWYWWTFTIDLHPFPHHWQVEWTNYGWGWRGLFGPIGFMITRPYREGSPRRG